MKTDLCSFLIINILAVTVMFLGIQIQKLKNKQVSKEALELSIEEKKLSIELLRLQVNQECPLYR